MNVREKRLAIVLGIVLLYAAGDTIYTYGFKDRLTKVILEDDPLAVAKDAVSKAQTSLAANALKPQQRYVLRMAEGPVGQDAFRLAVDPAAFGTSTAEGMPTLGYTGFVSVGTITLAIINGQEFGEGDVIPMTGEQIEKITPSEVFLLVPGSGVRRTVNYTGDGIETVEPVPESDAPQQ